jgi:hypothetical protein
MSPVNVFSAVSLTMWVAVLVWSFRQRKESWYHVLVLLMATITWWLGECIAIRLGKYQYADFPSWLVMPFAGSPIAGDGLERFLTHVHAVLKLPRVCCQASPHQTSWKIPFPIIALEASLVVAFLRLSFFRLRNKGFAAACAAGCFSAVLMVTLAAILDPVVSTTEWCGLAKDPCYHGLLRVRLWHWFTDENYTGYWFGVPMVNYVSWFVGMFVFSFMARLDDDGPRGLIRPYKHWWGYLLAVVVTIAAIFVLEFPLKIAIDMILVRVPEFIPIPRSVWEFVVVGVLLASNVFVIWRSGGVHPQPKKVGWVGTAPPIGVLAFCLVYLVLEPQFVLFVVWAVSAALTYVVGFRPEIATRRKPRPQVPAEAASV